MATQFNTRPDPMYNPFVTDPEKSGPSTRIIKTKDGLTPTTIPMGIIIGALIGIIAFYITKDCTANVHLPTYVGLGTGVGAVGATALVATLSARKDLDAKNPPELEI